MLVAARVLDIAFPVVILQSHCKFPSFIFHESPYIGYSFFVYSCTNNYSKGGKMYIYFTIRMLVLVILFCFFLFIFGGGCFLFYWVFLLAYFLYFIMSNTKQSFIVPTQDNLIDYLWYHYKERNCQKLLALITVYIHGMHKKTIFSDDINSSLIFEIKIICVAPFCHNLFPLR